MSKADRWFSYMREDIDRAQKYLEAGDNTAVHYFLGRLVGDVRVIREIMEENPGESDEPPKKE